MAQILENITNVRNFGRAGKLSVSFCDQGFLIYNDEVILLKDCRYWCHKDKYLYCFSKDKIWFIDKNTCKILKENKNEGFKKKYHNSIIFLDNQIVVYSIEQIIIIDKEANLLFNREYEKVELLINRKNNVVFSADNNIVKAPFVG